MAQQPLSSPQGRRDEAKSRQPKSRELLDAHIASADALRYAAGQEALIERLRGRVGELDFDHRLENDQDARFRVFYVAEPASVRAVQLLELDSRQPSPVQRMRLERGFIEEISTGGEVWMELLGEFVEP